MHTPHTHTHPHDRRAAYGSGHGSGPGWGRRSGRSSFSEADPGSEHGRRGEPRSGRGRRSGPLWASVVALIGAARAALDSDPGTRHDVEVILTNARRAIFALLAVSPAAEATADAPTDSVPDRDEAGASSLEGGNRPA